MVLSPGRPGNPGADATPESWERAPRAVCVRPRRSHTWACVSAGGPWRRLPAAQQSPARGALSCEPLPCSSWACPVAARRGSLLAQGPPYTPCLLAWLRCWRVALTSPEEAGSLSGPSAVGEAPMELCGMGPEAGACGCDDPAPGFCLQSLSCREQDLPGQRGQRGQSARSRRAHVSVSVDSTKHLCHPCLWRPRPAPPCPRRFPRVWLMWWGAGLGARSGSACPCLPLTPTAG